MRFPPGPVHKRWMGTAALLAGIAVILGAFGAHALDGRLDPDALDAYTTAVRYQMWHALALALWAATGGPRAVGWLFLIGTVLFAGSIYGLSFDGPAVLGPVTPLGGLVLITGWMAWAVTLFRSART